MSGAISPLSQYALMAWYSVKAHGQIFVYFKDLKLILLKGQN
jgi:hypothetical protein